MPRAKRSPDELTSDRIFGFGPTRVRIPELSRETHIAQSTLRDWRHRPEIMSLYGFARIARATHMTGDQVLCIIKGIK